MSNATQRLVGSYVTVLLLQVPLAFAAVALTDAVGGVIIGLPLFAWRIVEAVFGRADHRDALVWCVSLGVYFAAYSLLAVPAHFAFRKRAGRHALALALLMLAFMLVVAFAFPVRGLPI